MSPRRSRHRSYRRNDSSSSPTAASDRAALNTNDTTKNATANSGDHAPSTSATANDRYPASSMSGPSPSRKKKYGKASIPTRP